MAEQLARLSTPQIYRDLRERMVLLDIEPGTRLTEEALASEYGVSRTPIREVLARLHHDQLVEQRPGAGAVVAPIDIRQIRDVWAVRLKMAELVGDFVALPAPPEVLGRLRSLRLELDRVDGPRTLGRLYNRYHDLILELYTSATLRWIHDVLYQQTARAWLQFLPEMDLDAEIEVMAEELDRTLELVQAGSSQALAGMRADHMRRLVARFNDHLARPIV